MYMILSGPALWTEMASGSQLSDAAHQPSTNSRVEKKVVFFVISVDMETIPYFGDNPDG
jgi:hypothetical protein